jgi:two-component system chemotaxis sensor kinase CheA
MDDFTNDELEQLLAVFRDQAATILDEMSQNILLLEASPSDPQTMAQLRRSVHTIKGDSACIGLDRITELAHHLEDIIEAARDGELDLDAAVVDIVLQSVDGIRSAVCESEVRDLDGEELARLLSDIAVVKSGRERTGLREAKPSKINAEQARDGGRATAAPVLDAGGADLIRQIVSLGRQVYIVSLNQDNILRCRLAVANSGGVANFIPGSSFDGFNDDGHHLAIDSALSPDAVTNWLRAADFPGGGDSLDGRLWWVEIGDGGKVIASLVNQEDRAAAAPQPVASEPTKQRRGPEYVRVEAARIDTLLNLAGEMVIARSGMSQVLPDLENAFPKNDLVARFSAASMQMGKLISELQKSVLKMRMVTIDQVFRRFNRAMRELAAESGKQVTLDIIGGDTEMDRTLVDLIYEPLLHLLRNAVDHGLEPAEEREALGKPAAGKIAMRAYHEGNQVVIEVDDDGRGVEIAALKTRAIADGKITSAEAIQMSDEDALDLVFSPGVSTAREITKVSGRGIGAAAVKSAVEEMKGSVSVKSEPGAGTVFTLRMPLTLAIIKALLFKVQGQVFALPLLVVREVARVESPEMIYLDKFESFRLRDRFISLVRPSRIFGLDRRMGGKGQLLRPQPGECFVVIVSIEDVKFGIAVDSLIGEQELVIKPLDSEWVQNEALAGASLLGDGRVVLIMDAGAVFRKALKYEHVRERVAASA